MTFISSAWPSSRSMSGRSSRAPLSRMAVYTQLAQAALQPTSSITCRVTGIRTPNRHSRIRAGSQTRARRRLIRSIAIRIGQPANHSPRTSARSITGA